MPGKFVRHLNITKKLQTLSKNHCSKENHAQKYQMSSAVTPINSPKDSQQFDPKGREKKDRKVVGINMNLFVSDDRIQKTFFDQKELQIKMYSLLNVSHGKTNPEEFSLNDIEMLVDNKKEYIRSQAFLQAEG